MAVRLQTRLARLAGVVGLAAALSLASAATASAAESRAGAGEEIALGVTTVLANAVYLPAKLAYAGVGGLTGLVAYGLTLGSRETATAIWTPSVGGDYILTVDMVSGAEPFYFIGHSDLEE